MKGKKKWCRYTGYFITTWKESFPKSILKKKRDLIGSLLSHDHQTQNVFLTIVSELAILFLLAVISCSRERSNAKIAMWTYHLSVTPRQIHHCCTPDHGHLAPPLEPRREDQPGFVEQRALCPAWIINSVWGDSHSLLRSFSAILYQRSTSVTANANASERTSKLSNYKMC